MSRCTNCGLSFDEDNGWQEFCSQDCAEKYFLRGLCGKAKLNGKAKFQKWLESPKNLRKVKMDGEPATPPSFGRFQTFTYTTEEKVGKGKNATLKTVTHQIVQNVGSEIIIRPITEQERDMAIAQRGRSGFSDGHNSGHDFVPGQYTKVGLGWFPHDE